MKLRIPLLGFGLAVALSCSSVPEEAHSPGREINLEGLLRLAVDATSHQFTYSTETKKVLADRLVTVPERMEPEDYAREIRSELADIGFQLRAVGPTEASLFVIEPVAGDA